MGGSPQRGPDGQARSPDPRPGHRREDDRCGRSDHERGRLFRRGPRLRRAAGLPVECGRLGAPRPSPRQRRRPRPDGVGCPQVPSEGSIRSPPHWWRQSTASAPNPRGQNRSDGFDARNDAPWRMPNGQLRYAIQLAVEVPVEQRPATTTLLGESARRVRRANGVGQASRQVQHPRRWLAVRSQCGLAP